MNSKSEEIKILIIGSTPFSDSSQARSLATYLNGWKNKKFLVRQIYTRPLLPSFEYCEEFFQITDKMIIKNVFSKKHIGVVYSTVDNIKINNNIANQVDITTGPFFKFFSKKKNYFIRLMRGLLWKKRTWMNSKLLNWIHDFSPDIIFMNFGDDFYLFDMAETISQTFSIPIVTVISDDYYFSSIKSRSFFARQYSKKYLKTLKLFFESFNVGVAFNSQRIMNRYVEFFRLKTYKLVPIAYSDLFHKISLKKNCDRIEKHFMSYFGNFEFGRYKALISLADSLGKINKKITVCGTCKNKKVVESLIKHKSIDYMGLLDYSHVTSLASESQYLVIAESFDKSDSENVKYALSTKVADCLASGIPIVAIGSINSGAINYLYENKCALICSDESELIPFVEKLGQDSNYEKECSLKALELSTKMHDINKNGEEFLNLCKDLVQKSKMSENENN